MARSARIGAEHEYEHAEGKDAGEDEQRVADECVQGDPVGYVRPA